MSQKELEQAKVFELVLQKAISQTEGTARLNIDPRCATSNKIVVWHKGPPFWYKQPLGAEQLNPAGVGVITLRLVLV